MIRRTFGRSVPPIRYRGRSGFSSATAARIPAVAMDPLDAFLAGLRAHDRRLLGELVEEESEARGITRSAIRGRAGGRARPAGDGRAAAVELEAERDPPPDDGWDDDPEWDAPAIPYGDAELGRVATPWSIHPGPRCRPRPLPGVAARRRRKGVLKRAKRPWERRGRPRPDDPAARDVVRLRSSPRPCRKASSHPPAPSTCPPWATPARRPTRTACCRACRAPTRRLVPDPRRPLPASARPRYARRSTRPPSWRCAAPCAARPRPLGAGRAAAAAVGRPAFLPPGIRWRCGCARPSGCPGTPTGRRARRTPRRSTDRTTRRPTRRATVSW